MSHQDDVRTFHEKHSFPVGIQPGENHKTDHVREHLITEELSEMMLGIGEQNRVKIADALGDLLYVVYGAAVTYGIPLDAIFAEVHKSNMTKDVRKPGDTRLRDKGPNYVPPDIEGVLRRHGALHGSTGGA